MKTTASIVLLSLFALLVGGDAMAAWIKYKNPRFGFEIIYPDHLFTPGPPPANGDGLEFFSSDNNATINTWGAFNSLEQTPREYFNWIKNEVGVVDDVTYQRVKKNWIVISGFKGNRVYYEKTIFSCKGQMLSSIALSYPIGDKSIYDPLVGRITKSLTPKPGLDTLEGCE